MTTATQNWSPVGGDVYLAQTGPATDRVSNITRLTTTQQGRVAEAWGLWDDVSGFTAVQSVDDTGLARRATTETTFLGAHISWGASLGQDWTRVAVGDIASATTVGINKAWGDNGRYHEVYIDVGAEGVGDFQLGSRAFYTVVHELGHSVVGGGHLATDSNPANVRTQTVMNDTESNNSPTTWYASTPMSRDIDAAVALYGRATTTRLGNDTYGFNAHFDNAPYRAAFDFSVNTRPLVTIFDNGGNDTLDASGFTGRNVHIDLTSGNSSWIIGGQTFAVIYRESAVENGVGGAGNDELIGNWDRNILTGNGGADTLEGRGGNDEIRAGAGIDTAVFSAARSSYTVTMNTSGVITVAGFGAGAGDGVDTLYDVEQIRFSNGTFNLLQLGLDDYAGDASTLGSIGVGGRVTGNINASGDHDWIKVFLNGGNSYLITEHGAPSGGGSLADPYIRLYNSAGTQVAYNDDDGVGYDGQIAVRVGTSGFYYIDAAAFGSGVGTFAVDVRDLSTNNFRFDPPSLGISNFGAGASAGGWSTENQYPRQVGDVNGDGLADIVGFASNGVYVSLATGDGKFAAPWWEVANFGASPSANGWSSQDRYPRKLADVNGDGKADIVGFAESGTYVALATSNGHFAPAKLAQINFGAGAPGGGWTSFNQSPRELGDVNGDGKADIVAFGGIGTFVALGQSDGTFGSPTKELSNFGYLPEANGWSSYDRYPRKVADVNGDGKADIIGFAEAGTYVSLATGNGHFGPAIFAQNNFGAGAPGGGWSSFNQSPREVADVNADGRADIVAFGGIGTFVALGRSDGTFDSPFKQNNNFGYLPEAGNWSTFDGMPRLLGDVTGDHRADIIGFATIGVLVSQSHDYFMV